MFAIAIAQSVTWRWMGTWVYTRTAMRPQLYVFHAVGGADQDLDLPETQQCMSPPPPKSAYPEWDGSNEAWPPFHAYQKMFGRR